MIAGEKPVRTLVAPSILAANWGALAEDIKKVEAAGADYLHLDVMDGSFVPPISFGQEFIRQVSSISSLPLDVHLMINAPENQVDSFIDAGADIITFHLEATSHSHRLLQHLRNKGVKAGIAINPGTPASFLEPVLDLVDLVLIMTVNPGWGGQSFISSCLDKIRHISTSTKLSPDTLIEVDGGLNEDTATLCRAAGANLIVAGTYIFSSLDYATSIEKLRK